MAIFGIGKSQKNTEELTDISQIELPKHVGIIMDGNGR